MQHIWNEETNTCERCGLVKVTKKRKALINTRYDQYYTVYYSKSGIRSIIRPDYHYPGQYKLNF